MVVESSSARFELHNPIIGVHLEHCTTIFTIVCHSVMLLCFVTQEHVDNPEGTMLHHNAPEVSIKQIAGKSIVAVYL